MSDNSNVTNSGVSGLGRIKTEGEGAHGIWARDNNTVTNSGLGRINTEGEGAHGIQARDNNTVTNSGAINTKGDRAGSIWAGGIWARDNNTITNYGAINTKGEWAADLAFSTDRR